MRKRVYDPANPTDMAETYYVYEAGGKVVAIYENCVDDEPTPRPDSDGDGFTDDVDNCPCVYNPDQLDSDGDGVGDACDQFPGAPDPPPDCDGDGIPNSEDLCPTVAQAAPDDQDGDGFPDEMDQCPCEASETIDCSCVEPYNLVEWVIYGNAAQGRIAEGKPSNISRPASEGTPITEPEETFTRILDEKYYELKDHLGNARVVVSDMKQPTTESGLAPYSAMLTSYANYYPFGMVQPDRSWQGGQWRYGFNGKEMDNEWSGEGNVYDYGARMYDGRIARWTTVDPDEASYPSSGSYIFSRNAPTSLVDPDGKKVQMTFDKKNGTISIVDLDQYDAALPTITVSASDYKIGGIRDANGNLVKNQRLVIEGVFTGGHSSVDGTVTTDPSKPNELALPDGRYSLLELPSSHPLYRDEYRVDPDDGSPFNDHDEGHRNRQGEVRSGYRFHLGSVSWGCITVNKYGAEAVQRDEEWGVVRDIMDATSTTRVHREEGIQGWIPWSTTTDFGTIDVVGGDDGGEHGLVHSGNNRDSVAPADTTSTTTTR